MRDPKRIEELLTLLNQIWMRNPDLRFNQLVYDLQSGYSHKNRNIGKIIETDSDGLQKVGYDFFNIEDDKFIDYLKQVLVSL